MADLEYFDKTFVEIRVPYRCMHKRNVVVSVNCIAVDAKGSVKFLLTVSEFYYSINRAQDLGSHSLPDRLLSRIFPRKVNHLGVLLDFNIIISNVEIA